MAAIVRARPCLSRRSFLRGAAATAFAAVAGPALLGGCAPHWTGHKPGKVYLGMSAPDYAAALAQTGPVGVRRSFYQWGEVERELAVIAQDHAARRLPWVSFKPPAVSRPWAAIASGQYDSALRARAAAYATISRPVIVTFHHEPYRDGHGTPAEWAAAWSRIYDVMRQAQPLENVTLAPILQGFVFSAANPPIDPGAYLTDGVLSRAEMLGFDLYQFAGASHGSRMEAILRWLDARGADQPVGLGEVGCSDTLGPPGAAAYWRDAWAWTTANADRVHVVSYFNSPLNSERPWQLTASAGLLYAFRQIARFQVRLPVVRPAPWQECAFDHLLTREHLGARTRRVATSGALYGASLPGRPLTFVAS